MTYLHTRDGVADSFLQDMKETVAEIMKSPNAEAGGSVLIIFVDCKKEMNKVFFAGCNLRHGPKYSGSYDGIRHCECVFGDNLQSLKFLSRALVLRIGFDFITVLRKVNFQAIHLFPSFYF